MEALRTTLKEVLPFLFKIKVLVAFHFIKTAIFTARIKNKHKGETTNTQEGTSKSPDVYHQWGQVSKFILPIRDLVLDNLGPEPEQTGDGYSFIFRSLRN